MIFLKTLLKLLKLKLNIDMNVVSLFDGKSCGMMALEKAGIKVDNYYASEIDKYAMQVSKAIYPNIKRLGDVRNVTFFGLPDIDLLIGGSPCQGFSFAGKQLNFEDPRSKLFFEFVRLKEELQPKYFLLENVRMKKESQDIISKYMGVEPIMINSSLVSAQNRVRLYWTNIPGIGQPEDKGVLLKDILEDGSEKIGAQRGRYIVDGKRADHTVDSMAGKTEQRIEVRKDSKSNCLTTVGKDNLVIIDEKYYLSEKLINGLTHGSPAFKGRFKPHDKDSKKSYCLTARYAKCGKTDPYIKNDKGVRRLTPLECARLQTIPEHIIDIMLSCGVSDSQLYKMLGNGWTIDVIAHIFKNIKLKKKKK